MIAEWGWSNVRLRISNAYMKNKVFGVDLLGRKVLDDARCYFACFTK